MAGPADLHSATPAELQARQAAEREGLPFLLYREAGRQCIFALGGELSRVTIGRGEEVDVRLKDDEQISRLHAELARIGGEWTLSDDGLSRNGTFLNGERISGRKRLVDGDELRIGTQIVIFRAPLPATIDETVASRELPQVELTETQRRILGALCRPFKDGSPYATPATNREIAEQVFLSVDAVKGHLRVLFEKFEIGDLPQNQKRVRLVELAVRAGLISFRDL